MHKEPRKREKKEGPGSERFIMIVGRFVVALMWALLLAVVVFVVYLARRFSAG
jgi:type II secretory pathway component PulF